MKKNRFLTVSSIASQRDFKHVYVPYIRLSGKWLEAAGFATGDMISVEPQVDGLLIRKVEGAIRGTDPGEKRTGSSGKQMMVAIAERIAFELPVKEPV